MNEEHFFLLCMFLVSYVNVVFCDNVSMVVVKQKRAVVATALFCFINWDDVLLLVLLSYVVGVDVGLIVFEAGTVLGATVIVERGAGFTFGDILIIHCRSIQSIVGVAFAGFGVARGESEDCNQGSGSYYFSFHIDCVFTFFSNNLFGVVAVSPRTFGQCP